MKVRLRYYIYLVSTTVVGILGLYSCSADSSGGVAPIQDPQPQAPPPPGQDRGLNVRDFGALGNGVHDDLPAFRAALDALSSSGGGTLLVPAGTYLFQSDGSMGTLGFGRKRSNITIAGDGMERSILRMAPVRITTGATHVILLNNVTGITIRDLTIDANVPNATYTDDQSKGIEIRNSSDVRIERVRIMRVFGDGIRLVGRFRDAVDVDGGDTWTERVVIQDSRIENTGRAGIGIQRAVRDVQILNNTFERVSDQSLSSEPSSSGLEDVAPHDILMEGNVIRGTGGSWEVAMAGFGRKSDPAERFVFRNNRVENGSVRFGGMYDLRIEGNVFIGGSSHAALELPDADHVEIVDNDFSGKWPSSLILVTAKYDGTNNEWTFPAHVTLRNNRLRASGEQSGILVQDALTNVAVLDNEIHGVAGGYGIQVFNRSVRGLTRSEFTVRGNVIRNFRKGVLFATNGDPFKRVVIEANNIDHDQNTLTETTGIAFSGTGPYETFAVVSGNTFGTGIKTNLTVK